MHAVLVDCIAMRKLPLNLTVSMVLKKLLQQACIVHFALFSILTLGRPFQSL